MTGSITDFPAWEKLTKSAGRMALPENHLSRLTADKNRLSGFSCAGGGLFYDFSRQRVDEKVMEQLLELADEANVCRHFSDMMAGRIVNRTENRAALHTAARNFSNNPIYVNGMDVMPEIRRVRQEIREFSNKIHSGELRGSTGKAFEQLVVIGIGGSYLGTEFAARAMEALADKSMSLYFLSNVDIDCFGSIVQKIDPEKTLWVVISKSYTTTETMANTALARSFIVSRNLAPKDHLVTVTSKGSPGDDPSNPVLQTFHMFDFIGGRFSVTSAVGGVPLSLYLGWDRFERFLKGAEEMDMHAQQAPPDKNIALLSALIGIWNNNFLKYPAVGIIPYCTPLAKFPAHVQQLYMESNGKSVTQDRKPIGAESGVIVFGEPGTNAQHSFFQLAHQGRQFPIEFIGVLRPHNQKYKKKSKGVTNHQELWANLLAQPGALACGSSLEKDTARHFSGNRPSSTLLLDDLCPENIGRLLAFYEARTVYEAFIWDINPFDQFGVELGKKLASEIRHQMALKNQNPEHRFDSGDSIADAYLEMLFTGSISKDQS
jgi:glucose-6-phosphate isomerase